jgi:hypothetical protein
MPKSKSVSKEVWMEDLQKNHKKFNFSKEVPTDSNKSEATP